MMTRVFVYGSLLRGLGNHRVIAAGRFVRAARTADEVWAMLDLGPYPGVVPAPTAGCAIQGEVYEVDDETFAALDRLEGHPHFYQRKPVELDGGETAWMYVLRMDDKNYPRVPNNDWRAYIAAREPQAVAAWTN